VKALRASPKLLGSNFNESGALKRGSLIVLQLWASDFLTDNTEIVRRTGAVLWKPPRNGTVRSFEARYTLRWALALPTMSFQSLAAPSVLFHFFENIFSPRTLAAEVASSSPPSPPFPR